MLQAEFAEWLRLDQAQPDDAFGDLWEGEV